MELSVFLQSVIFVVLVFYLKSLFTRRNGKPPPGPKPWPIIGNLPDMLRANPDFPHLAMAKLAEEYGDVMSVKLGSHNFVVLSSLQAMNDVLTKDESNDRYEFQFVYDRSFNKNLGLIFSNGERWKEVRRFTLRKLRDFGLGKRDQMDEIIRAEVALLTDHMKEEIRKQELVRGTGQGGIFKMDSYFALGVVNCLWKMVAGSGFGLNHKQAQQMMDFNYEVVDATALNKLCVSFPLLGTLFPVASGAKRQKDVAKGLQEFMRELVAECRKRDYKNDPQCFIDLFLKEIDKNEEASFFSEEELIMCLKDLFLGGSETSSHTLTFAVLHLLLNKNVQEKIREELELVIPKGMSPSLFDTARLPYTQATLLEISRMGNVIPLPFPRKAITDIPYKGYVIPQGVALSFNLHCVFRSKELWDDPDVFRPSRFLDSNGRLCNTEKFPIFGFGKRFCMGEGLARTTTFHFLVGLMKNFDLEPVPGQPVPTDDLRPGSHTLCPPPFDVLIKIRYQEGEKL